MRLYGTARTLHRGESGWQELYAHFPDTPGARQIFDVTVDLVQTSCGLSVPRYDYVEDRTLLSEWAAKKGEAGIAEYWAKKNQFSLDRKPTHILERTLDLEKNSAE